MSSGLTDEQLKTFNFRSVAISEILPQRRPFVMVSRLVHFDWKRTVSEFDVDGKNPFTESMNMSPEGFIENIAQTCALRIGFINRYILLKPVDIGYVCTVKNFKVLGQAAVGETIRTVIDVSNEFGSIIMVDASVEGAGGILATGSMTIALDEGKPVPEEGTSANEYAVVKIADNIISPLGTTTEQNYRSLLAGRSELKQYPATRTLPEAYFASLIDEDSLTDEYASFNIGDGYTKFEKRIILSIAKALKGTGIDTRSNEVVFVISSTKGNVDLLDAPDRVTFTDDETLGSSALKIAGFFGSRQTPITVSNACISGLSAQIAAYRMLRSGRYRTAIVSGSDVQGRFTISGFQSFHALSDEPCRPFDADRKGLNLGEAAATIIYTWKKPEKDEWILGNGAIRNDANHISGPSRTGEGSYRALKAAIGDFSAEDLALVSVHGTSTAYNDEMESKAVTRAGLQNVPLNSLKGYYGHTMGAAGILETILSMASIDDGKVLGTRGYRKCGVTCPVRISPETVTTGKRSFVKLLSGFGGCNAAGIFMKYSGNVLQGTLEEPRLSILHHVRITPDLVELDGNKLNFEAHGSALLLEIYEKCIGGYPKFHKMDPLAKLGFAGSELLLGDFELRRKDCEDRAVILFGRTASLCDDMAYQESIRDPENYYPSPALFVYTLPNIVTGEIAIRNKYYGETSFYVLENRDEKLMEEIVGQALGCEGTLSAIAGWLECPDPEHFECDLKLVVKYGRSDS